jgi:hypothetical protein
MSASSSKGSSTSSESNESLKEQILVNRLDNISESDERSSLSKSVSTSSEKETKLTADNYLIADILTGINIAVR